MAAIYKVKLAPVAVGGELYQEGETFELDENAAQSLLKNGIVDFVESVGKTPTKIPETVSQFATAETPEGAIAPETVAEPKVVSESPKPKAAK